MDMLDMMKIAPDQEETRHLFDICVTLGEDFENFKEELSKFQKFVDSLKIVFRDE
jgi:hypothetical protein